MMANKITKQELGAFAAGAIPPPFKHIFLDFDGVVVDLTGFSERQMNIEAIPPVSGTLGASAVSFTTNGEDGSVTYAWAEDDMADPADYEAQIWVSNGTQKYESDLLTYRVYDGPGDAP